MPTLGNVELSGTMIDSKFVSKKYMGILVLIAVMGVFGYLAWALIDVD